MKDVRIDIFLPSTPATTRTPSTPTSMTHKIGFVYGSPLDELDSTFPKITECHLIRFWTQLYDEYRGTKKEPGRAKVINDVSKHLISLWKSHFLETLGEKMSKLKCLVLSSEFKRK